MRKTILICVVSAVVLVMLMSLSLTGCKTAAAAETTAAAAETTAAAAETTAAAKEIKLGMIPKFTGVDYFIACENGAKKAAADLGVTLDWQGDPSGQESAAKQQAYIQTFIDKGYDGILVSALDPDTYAKTLEDAMAQGIKVITWDADVNPAARNFFINQTENSAIGKTLMSSMGKTLPEGGIVALVSSDPNSSNQNAWIAAIQDEYNSKKDSDYKNIVFFDKIIYAGNNQADADRAVNTLLTQNPDIKGIFALSSMATPATAKASKDLGLAIGSISIQCLGIPTTSLEDMKSGLLPSVTTWQPYDLGYLAVEFATDLIKGNIDENITSYKSSLSGKKQIADIMYAPEHKITEDKQVILGDPVVYTLENAAGFKGYPEPTSGLE